MFQSHAKRVLVLGGTGTIGRAMVRALIDRGHQVVCIVRLKSEKNKVRSLEDLRHQLSGAVLRVADVCDPQSMAEDGFCGEAFDAVMSCLASRTGTRKESHRIDYQANLNALRLAESRKVRQMVLLSAICVQKPRLAFQRAKLAFEKELIESGLRYSIVRPTAFFKSLSGQVVRVRQGKSYMIFGDGALTACKPISDSDLADYLADCLDAPHLQNRILPIGGPGPAITPKAQGEFLFSLLGEPARFRSVAPSMLKTVGRVLSVLSRVYPPLAARAEYARIGHYYATESMLVLDPETGQYNEALTPSTGEETLFDHYRELWAQSDLEG
ncbi:MAG: NAD(P)H-binding protein [Pseudomonadota bacterium]